MNRAGQGRNADLLQLGEPFGGGGQPKSFLHFVKCYLIKEFTRFSYDGRYFDALIRCDLVNTKFYLYTYTHNLCPQANKKQKLAFVV